MTLAFDAATVFDFTVDNSTTHTPAGTPKGVIVLITQGAGTPETMTSVTYGGVAMSNTVTAVTATSQIWFLGAAIPTGAQTVAFDQTQDQVKRAVIITVTAASDTSVDTSGTFEGTGITTVTVTLTTTATTFLAGVLHSGADTVGEMTEDAAFTLLSERDYGTNGASYVYRTSNPAAGSPVVTWTQTSNFGRACAIAIKEGAGGGGATVNPFGMSGFFGG